MKKIIFFVAFSIFFFTAFPAISEPDYNSPEMIRSFAQWLYEKKEYERAAVEYLRYYFIAPNSEKDVVLYKIGICQENGEDYEKAKKTFKQFLNTYSNSTFFEEVYYRYAYCLFKIKEYSASVEQISVWLSSKSPYSTQMLLLLGMNQLSLEQWDSANASFTEYLTRPDIQNKKLAEQLAQFTLDAKNIPEKNPVLAGFLSVLFPGLGKFYAERPEDAITSIILVGLFGGFAAYSFYLDGITSVSGWTYASIAGIFYIGDIWGSVVAAYDYNNHKKRVLKENIDETISEF